MFRDRVEAGRRLAAKLARYKDEDALVFALPRGGVSVAEPIAVMLNAPLDLVLARKIGVPRQRELAMGAVADGGSPVVVRNEDVIAMAGVSEAEFDAVCQRELKEIERRRRRYLGSRAPFEAEGRVAIVVDDGVATGATTRAALRAVRARRPKTLVLAVPVAPPDALEFLKGEADETICLEVHADFGAIGYFYADFHQLDDDEVIAILDCSPSSKGKSKDSPLDPRKGEPRSFARHCRFSGGGIGSRFKRGGSNGDVAFLDQRWNWRSRCFCALAAMPGRLYVLRRRRAREFGDLFLAGREHRPAPSRVGLPAAGFVRDCRRMGAGACADA